MNHVNDVNADTQNKNKKTEKRIFESKIFFVICFILWLFSVLYKMQNHKNVFF